MKRIADSELLYSLKKENEWAIAEAEGYKLFSVWSANEFAELNATGAWVDYKSVEIRIEQFENDILPVIETNKYLINVFSIKGRTGFVVEIDEFLTDLKEELKNYE